MRGSWKGVLHHSVAGAVIAVLAALLPVDAVAQQRQFTAEQDLQALASAVRAEGGIASSAEQATSDLKSVANGLVIDGTGSYNYSGSTVTLTASRIDNNSYTRTSGTLRLELWATATKPGRGEGFTGYQLAVTSTLSPLPPRTYYSSVSKTTSMTRPPDGTYWMVLVLAEYSSSSCSSNQGYCLSDTLVFSTPQTFGTPVSFVTLVATSGNLCVRDVPIAVANALQGLYTQYPPSTSCASLGFSFYAGDLGDGSGLRVYTRDSTLAAQLCASGLVVNCTSYPAPAADFTDLWWNPSESGWGLVVTQHASGVAVVTWYTYDSVGRATWYLVACRFLVNTCSGAMYEQSGPPFGPTFNPNLVVRREVGTMTLTFSSSSAGTMSYTLNGVPGAKAITRFAY